MLIAQRVEEVKSKKKKERKTNQWLKTDMGCEHNRKVQVLFLVKGKS